MPEGSPWADPTTPTQPGAPYQGPPPTAPPSGSPPQYGLAPPAGRPARGPPPPAPPCGYPPQYGYAAPYGQPGYGYPPPWGPVPPNRPQRPGPVITSAVLAFVQAGVVLIASLYVWFITSMVGLAAQDNPAVFASSRMESLTTEATALAVLQVLSAALLIGAGVRALAARSRPAWLLILAA